MPNDDFFYRAYGKSFEEFEAICAMPDKFILYRGHKDGKYPESDDFRKKFLALSANEKQEYWDMINRIPLEIKPSTKAVKELLDIFSRYQ
jgi:hypothetical protein